MVLRRRQFHLDELLEQPGERSALARGAVNAGPARSGSGVGPVRLSGSGCPSLPIFCVGKYGKTWEDVANMRNIWDDTGNI